MSAAADEELRFPDDGDCFGCSRSNPGGLQMRFRRRGARVVSDHVIAEAFHGAPGIAHGGIVATLLDELSCATAHFLGGTHVVTGELCVRYERPVPVETPIAMQAEIVRTDHPRYLVIEASIHRDGEVLARSTGKFFRHPGLMDTP